MIKTIFHYILVAIVCMTTGVATAAPPIFHNYSLEQASPIYSIDQDADGMIWLGTAKGLYSFDGYRFVSHYDAHGDNLIYAVCTYDDYIIMGGFNGVTVYDRKRGKIVGIKNPIKEEVRTIIRQGNQIFIGSNKALYKLLPEKKEISIVSRIPHNIFSIIATDRGLLIGTINGLYEYVEGRCHRLNLFASQQQSAVSALKYDRKTGKYWVGTFQNLYSYDLHTGDLQMIPDSKGMVVKSLEITPRGLFISSDDGLYIMKNGVIEHLVHDSQNISSLGNNIVWNVFCDKSQNILLGSERGLSVVMQNGWGDYHSLSSLTGSTIGNDLTCMMKDSQGTMWLGGTVGLIHMTQPVCWFLQNNSAYTLSHNRVRDVCEDNLHNVWISTDIGLNLYDRKQNRMTFRMIRDAQTKKEVPWIYDVMDDGMGRMWLGVCNGGVYVVSRSALLQADYTCFPERHIVKGLSSDVVNQLIMGRGNKVWVRTTKGLDIIDAHTYKVRTLSKDHADMLFADHKGNMWVADSKDIKVYSSPDKIAYDISLGTTLDNNSVVAMMEIDGNIWVVTQSCCTAYHDGKYLAKIRLPYMTPHCACYDAAQKQIVIGGVDGTVTINPQKILRQNNKQSLILSNLLVNGIQFKPEDESLLTTKGIQLSYDQNNLEFQISDLPYLNTCMTIYAYRLKGLEKDWHYLQRTGDNIVYNSLPDGDYTLEVHAVDGFDKIGKDLYALGVDILPPWYLSVWAKMIYLLLAGALIWIGQKFYMTKKTLRKEQQARQQIMAESSARVNFYETLSHNLHRGLSRVMSLITIMAEEDSEHLYRPNFMRLGYETTKVNAFIHQALDTGNSAPVNEDSSALHNLNIVGFCNAIVHGMAEDVRTRKIKLTQQSQDNFLFYKVDITEWDTIIYTLLRSIIDYSDDGASIVMSITPSDEGSTFIISLSSTLFAVSEQKLPFFFQRYYELVDNNDIERTHNMYLIKEYADQHQGCAKIRMDEKKVVTLTLKLPLTAQLSPQASNNSASPAISMRDDKLLKEITSIIEKNISNSDFNVTELQKEVGIGSKLLYRKIKLCTGMSPVEYIRDIRMKRAALLLAEGRFAISEVMYMVGFSNSGYFSKCFQKAFGTTPTNYMHQKSIR